MGNFNLAVNGIFMNRSISAMSTKANMENLIPFKKTTQPLSILLRNQKNTSENLFDNKHSTDIEDKVKNNKTQALDIKGLHMLNLKNDLATNPISFNKFLKDKKLKPKLL